MNSILHNRGFAFGDCARLLETPHAKPDATKAGAVAPKEAAAPVEKPKEQAKPDAVPTTPPPAANTPAAPQTNDATKTVEVDGSWCTHNSFVVVCFAEKIASVTTVKVNDSQLMPTSCHVYSFSCDIHTVAILCKQIHRQCLSSSSTEVILYPHRSVEKNPTIVDAVFANMRSCLAAHEVQCTFITYSIIKRHAANLGLPKPVMMCTNVLYESQMKNAMTVVEFWKRKALVEFQKRPMIPPM
jgi:hypothetical protein